MCRSAEEKAREGLNNQHNQTLDSTASSKSFSNIDVTSTKTSLIIRRADAKNSIIKIKKIARRISWEKQVIPVIAIKS